MLMRQSNPSQTQRDVLRAIQSLPGWSEAREEVLTDDGLFSMDIAMVRPDGTKVAIEVDGPTHFMRNNLTRMNGATLLRNRMLESRGWRVVSVSVKQWSKMSPAVRKKYLLDLLEAD